MRTTVHQYCVQNGLQWILDQWDTAKNDVTPHELSYGSKKHIWWKCTKGHSWQSSVGAKLKYRYHCAYCSGQRIIPGENDFATLYPTAYKQWIPEKNMNTPHPSTVKTRNTTKVWWRCEKNHEWKASYASRANGRGCAVCAGKVLQPGVNDLTTQKPFTAQNYSEKNSISLSTVFSNDTRIFWWNCKHCRTIFQSTAHRWTGIVYCDTCALQRSSGEVELGKYIETLLTTFSHMCEDKKSLLQYNVRKTIKARTYELDIYLPDQKIAFEYNGDYWHSDAALYAATGEYAASRHQRKLNAMKEIGITLYTVWEHDWTHQRTVTQDAIKEIFTKNTVPPILQKLESVFDRPELYSSVEDEENTIS